MTEPPTLEREVAEACLEHELVASGERVLVAVSGGADSTALALLLGAARAHGLPLELVLAHLDHGWREPDEAARDRAVVEAVAARLDVPLACAGPPSTPVRTEDDARRWRYRVLDRLAREHGCTKVATGHHLRDQAETVWMRLKRGSGPVGLRGIPRRRPLGEHGVSVVRPLLDVEPERLRTWLGDLGVAWHEDATNEDVSRDRARARRQLKERDARGDGATLGLADLAGRLQRRLRTEEEHLAERLDTLVVTYPVARAVEVPRAALAELPPGLLDLAIRRLGRRIGADRHGPFFTRRHLRGIQARLRDGGALDLPRGRRFEVSGRRAWLRQWRARTTPPAPPLGVELLDGAAFDVRAFLQERSRDRAALDADRLGATPRLRRVRPGDHFVPWGREPDRTVDVVRWLTKRQVPVWLREVQLVVEGASGVAWVCGHRVDRTHAVGPETGRVAVLRVGGEASGGPA